MGSERESLYPGAGMLHSPLYARMLRPNKIPLSHQAPAGDIPIRSISIAFDGSCLVAGNNKVRSF